jgi:hypothetical protein
MKKIFGALCASEPEYLLADLSRQKSLGRKFQKNLMNFL